MGNDGDGKKRSVVVKASGWGNKWAEHRGSENILCDTIMMEACPDTLVQTHNMYNTESEP